MTSELIPNLVLGTGPAAIAAAFALRRQGVPFEVLDVGYDLEPERQAMVQALSVVGPDEWPGRDTRTLFPPPVASAKGGVEKRLSFGSDFPYKRPPCLSCATTECTIDLSHGLGGFGNVWGAAMLPYSGPDLRDWPLSSADLADSYRNLSRFVPVSADVDPLEEPFPLYHDKSTNLSKSEQTRALLQFLDARAAGLQRRGVAYGRARVAVDSSGGISTCRYCGKCLDGCPYGSIFNPRLHFKQLELDGTTIHKGWYALEFQEGPEEVTVTAVNVHDGSPRTFRAGRLFVGMGTISSTRFLARSLKLLDTPIHIQDSQYFFFPVLAYRKATDITVRFTLADIFLDILSPAVSPYYVHLQIYGLNEIFRQTLQSMLPSPLRRPSLLNAIESRFYLFQGFLHSSESGHLELTVTSSHADRDEIRVRGITNPASLTTAKRTKALIRNLLAGFGGVPPLQLTMVAPGRSFHAGGSFPMGKKNTVYTSDLLGRPAGLRRIHVVDASIFPSIPATTIAYTAMANSDRVVNEAYRNGYL